MVEIWLDTIDEEAIKIAHQTGLLFGVTTNPTILSKTSNVKDTLTRLLDIQEGPLAVQVISTDSSQMSAEAIALSHFSQRIFVKIPLTCAGLVAIQGLKHTNIPLIGTAVMSLNQAIVASSLPLKYVAIYFSRITPHPSDFLKSVRELYERCADAPKILAASLKQMSQVTDCILNRVDAVTLKSDQCIELLRDSTEVNECIDRFSRDWCATRGSVTLTDVI